MGNDRHLSYRKVPKIGPVGSVEQVIKLAWPKQVNTIMDQILYL